MQRAAAKGSASSAASTPSRDGPPAAKRQKASDSEPSTPVTPDPATPRSSDLQIISNALAEEERLRSQARIRHAAESGETEWVLNLPGSGVQANGGNHHTGEDSTDEIWQNETTGRLSFGGFKRRKAQSSSTPKADTEDDEELSEGELQESDPEERASKRARAEAVQGELLDRTNLQNREKISGYRRGAHYDGRTKKKSNKKGAS